MIFLKGCPKCHGDVFEDSYSPNKFTCLQCSYPVKADEVQELRDQAAARKTRNKFPSEKA